MKTNAEVKVYPRKGIWSVDTYGNLKLAIKSTQPDYDGFNRSVLIMSAVNEEQAAHDKANAEFMCKAVNEYDKLKEDNEKLISALRENNVQLEYLSEKFAETGTTNTIISRNNALISQLQYTQP